MYLFFIIFLKINYMDIVCKKIISPTHALANG